MGLTRPINFKENSDLKEEENQPDNENNIGKQWAKTLAREPSADESPRRESHQHRRPT